VKSDELRAIFAAPIGERATTIAVANSVASASAAGLERFTIGTEVARVLTRAVGRAETLGDHLRALVELLAACEAYTAWRDDPVDDYERASQAADALWNALAKVHAVKGSLSSEEIK